MIPDHLIDQAAAAIYAVSVFGDKFAIDAWHDMPDTSQVKTTTRMFARAALKAVAADIWADGYAACYAWQLQSDRWPYPDEDEQAEEEYAEACGRSAATRAPNPYREQEA